MATQIWIAAALPVSQVNTITPASVSIGNVFTLTINSKSVSFTATAATVANVTAGLVAAASANGAPAEFLELTWTNNTTNLTATSLAGVPFTQTSSASGGSATLTTALTTAASGPNFWSTAANWSTGSVPASADDVYLDTATAPILYGLGQSAVTLNSLTTSQNYTGTIGLPKKNANGYTEYRPDFLAISATTITIGTASGQNGSGFGSGRIKLDTGTAATAITVLSMGSSLDTPLEAFQWRGSNASNALKFKGQQTTAALAGFLGDVGAILSLYNDGASVRSGSGITFEASCVVQNFSGTMSINSSIGSGGSATNYGGVMTVLKAAAVPTLYANGGTVDYQSTGTVGQANVGPGQITCVNDTSPRTFSNTSMFPGGNIVDPAHSITYTTGAVPAGATQVLSAA